MATNPAPPVTYELGTLVNGHWRQWANAAGQDYYENVATRATQFKVPDGYEDDPRDTWAVDNSKTWPQWVNNRTGRIRRTDPNPPRPQTYVDEITFKTHLQAVVRSPQSHEFMYRRVMSAVLNWFFPRDQGFDILQEESRGETRPRESVPDFAVFTIQSRPGGSLYTYDFCMVESKRLGQNWPATQDQLRRHCAGTDNESKEVYGAVHIGLEIQFFKAQNGQLQQLSGRLHLKDHAPTVTQWFQYMKTNPFPFV